MNKLILIGNLTRDPEIRTVNTANGAVSACNFTIAVNKKNARRQQNGQNDADFFRVTTWRQTADNCAKYLAKGRKVCVTGPVSYSTFAGQDGTMRVVLEVTADEVEFLSSRSDTQDNADGYVPPVPDVSNGAPAGFTAVETDELPF